jgi:hypothetical protein
MSSNNVPSDVQCFTSLEGISFVVNNAGQTALPVQAGWNASTSNFRAPTGVISSGIVHLAGAAWTTSSNTLAVTLPASLRPAAAVYVPISLCQKKGRLFISSTGDVNVYAETGSYAGCDAFFDGVTYAVAPTAANGWTCLAPTNGWASQAFGTRDTCVKDVDGIVRFSGGVATSGSNLSIFTLPAALRSTKENYVTVDLFVGTMGRLYIPPTGVVTVQAELATTNATKFTSFEGAAFAL